MTQTATKPATFRNDWEFENCFATDKRGRRQLTVLHRFRVLGNTWHVCWVDSNNYYGHGFYRYDDGRFVGVEAPTVQEIDAAEAEAIRVANES